MAMHRCAEILELAERGVPVVVVRTPAAADALLDRGVVGIAWEGSWRDHNADDLGPLRPLLVCVLGLSSPEDRRFAQDAERSLHKRNVPMRSIVVADSRHGADLVDQLRALGDDELGDLLVCTQPRPPASHELTLTSLGDLLAAPEAETEWLVQDRIPVGGVTMIVGKPKTGKSTAARNLALEVARAGSWLGHECRRGMVWYLALEDKQGEVTRHFRQMGATAGEQVRFLFASGDDSLLPKLHDLASREQPDLIVIDPLQRLVRAQDLNNYAEVTLKLEPITALARQCGAAVLLVHHAKKSRTMDVDSILGSTALAGSVDNILMLNWTDKYRLLSSVQRIGPDLPDTVVLLDAATGRVSLGQSKQAAERDAVADAIMSVLRRAPVALTQKEIEEQVTGRTGLLRMALPNLVRRGQAFRGGQGTKGDPYRYHVDRLVVPCSLVPPKGGEQQNK